MEDNNWKQQELLWKLHLCKVSDLEDQELKMLIFCDALSDHANCVNLGCDESHETDNLRKAIKHLNSQKIQNKILNRLLKKNILIPHDGDNINQITENICAHCRLTFNSKECMKRRGTHFINKNHKTWKTTPKTSFNEPHAKKLLQLNGLDADQPIKQRINATLKEIKKSKTTTKRDEKESSFMDNFQEYAESINSFKK